MPQNSVVLLIPARFQSQRMPGKPLALIEGESLIGRVASIAKRAAHILAQNGLKVQVAVVTDDERIENHVKEKGHQALRVDDDVASGSERIYLAYERFLSADPVDLIINIQGDEPLLKEDSLVRLVQDHLSRSEFDIMTMVHAKDRGHPDFLDPNRVKAVFSAGTQECHYFSRSPVPYVRDAGNPPWFQHIGVYSYRVKALRTFCQAPVGELENLEKLEQLRALDLGLRLGACEIEYESIGVDTPSDILKVEGVLRG